MSTTAAYGVLFYAYGVLLIPMQRDLGWTRSFLSGVFSAALVVSAGLSIPVGRFLDRHPPALLLLVSAGAASVGVVGWGLAPSRGVFVAVWLLLGACQAVLFYEPAFTILTKQFHGIARYRAITAVTLLAGLASTIFGPLTAALNHQFEWRTAVVVLAVVLAVSTLPTFALGLRRLGVTSSPPTSVASAVPQDVLRTLPFWLLTFAYLLSAVTTFGVAVHLVPFLEGRGTSVRSAALALGAVGLVQVLGRSLYVRLTAGRASVHVATWVLGAKAAGLALLLVFPSAWGIVAFVLVYGSANGLGTLTRAATIGDLYGHVHYGAISAVVTTIASFAGAVTPFAVAYATELSGSQTMVFTGLVAASALSAIANEMVGHGSR